MVFVSGFSQSPLGLITDYIVDINQAQHEVRKWVSYFEWSLSPPQANLI